MKQEIKNRIASLRTFMMAQGISAFVTPSTDPHAGEYTPEHWESRKWISGFTGSAGTAVVTLHDGGLWTDSRYFLQAEDQLAGTGLSLFKDRMPGTPSITQWLGAVLKPGDKVGIDGWVTTTAEAEGIATELNTFNLELKTVKDPYDTLWTNRPAIPEKPVFVLPEQLTGASISDKVASIREAIDKNNAEGILISALDEIAWTLNLRGDDVHCNPVFVSYLLLTDNSATLYIEPKKLSEKVSTYLEVNGIETKPYTAIAEDLFHYQGNSIQLSDNTNYALYSTIQPSVRIIRSASPVCFLKAIKNPTEIEGFHHAMLRDGVAMVRFIMWLKEAVKSEKETEITIDEKLYSLRAAHPYFKGISFDSMAGNRSFAYFDP